MFKKSKDDNQDLQDLIDALMISFRATEPGTPEFDKIVTQLIKLQDIKTAATRGKKVTADTLATVAANLGGILLILGHERAHVVTTKALGFVQKLH